MQQCKVLGPKVGKKVVDNEVDCGRFISSPKLMKQTSFFPLKTFTPVNQFRWLLVNDRRFEGAQLAWPVIT
jgi:hypothetical protein